MKKKISVIIPVYNVSKYLDECMESVVKQSYPYLEIILIDDGSTDQSGIICDRWAEKDERIIAIHKENDGAASAKNVGLRIATGEYLTFLDSDDYLEEGAYKHMVKQMEEQQADIVQCCFNDLFVDEKVPYVSLERNCEFTVEEYLRRYTVDWTCGLLWDKLYKRSLFENVYFEEGHIVDDEFFTNQGVMNAKKIVHSTQIIYNYRKRKSSVTAKPEYKERVVADKLDYLDKRRKKVCEKFPGLKKEFEIHFLNMLVWLSKDANISNDNLETIKSLLKQYFKEEHGYLLDLKTIIKLKQIQFTSVEKILSKKNSEETIKALEKYYS